MFAYMIGYVLKIFIKRILWEKQSIDIIVYLLYEAEFLPSWLPTLGLHLNYLSSSHTQSVKKRIHHFSPQGPASSHDFCISINGINSLLPDTQPRNLSHLLFASLFILVSAILLHLSSFPSPLPPPWFLPVWWLLQQKSNWSLLILSLFKLIYLRRWIFLNHNSSLLQSHI